MEALHSQRTLLSGSANSLVIVYLVGVVIISARCGEVVVKKKVSK